MKIEDGAGGRGGVRGASRQHISKTELKEFYKVINGIDYDDITVGLEDIISQFYIRVTITNLIWKSNQISKSRKPLLLHI